MVECSQCLPEEMREGGERWRDEAAPLQRRGPGLLSVLLPASEAHWWAQLWDVRLFSGQHVSGAALFQSWPLSKRKKNQIAREPSRHVALPHLPLPARYPPSAVQQYVSCPRCCDKTGRLYVGDSHIRACVSQTGVAQPWLGKETFICRGICHEDCGAFLPNLTEKSLTPAPCARASGRQVIMNSHMHQDVPSARLFISHNINMWRHSSTFKLTVILPSDFNSEPDGPHVHRCAEARPPPLSCQGVCFLAPPNGSNYTTDTYNCVLSLLTHHMNQCRAHPVPQFKREKKK